MIVFPLGLALLIQGCITTKPAMRKLTDQVRAELATTPGVFAVAFKNLSNGEAFSINGDSVFHAASTMKTPVLIEVYRQAAEGKFSLNDSVVLRNEFSSIVDGSPYSLDSSDDSEQELYRHIGEKRTVSALLYQMITVSSNFATNLVIGMVDAKNVTQSMRKLGANKIQVLRGVEDNKAFAKGLNNTTTANDLRLIFENIANGKAVSPDASAEMIRVLLDQHFNEIIPAQLPAGVKVAHKTGSITGVQHDSGIVFLPDGRQYVLIILSKNLVDEKAAVKAMANVSKLIYDYVMNHR